MTWLRSIGHRVGSRDERRVYINEVDAPVFYWKVEYLSGVPQHLKAISVTEEMSGDLLGPKPRLSHFSLAAHSKSFICLIRSTLSVGKG